ncbi:MAG: nuclear transport factor 2 family protein [Coleofasciculus sp. C2-GNP5-27]
MMTKNDTTTVWDEHIQAWDADDLDAIMVHYTEDSVMIVNNTVYKGTEAIRKVFDHLFKLFNNGTNKIDPAVIAGEIIYITWHFQPEAEQGKEYYGTDTFVVQNGLIKYQTIASLLYEKYPVAS